MASLRFLIINLEIHNSKLNMKLAKTSNPKLRDTAKFRVNPDEAIRDYRLEKDVKASRQALTPNLWLNIRSIGEKGTTHVKFRKDFYFASNGTLTKFLGAFLQVSYRDALNLADKYLEANLTLIFLKILSPSYLPNILNASGWVGSLRLSSKNGKFTNLASKTITSIAFKEIRKIADSIFSSRKYSALWDFC